MSAGAVECSASAECTVAVAARGTAETECAAIAVAVEEVRWLVG